MSDEVLKAVDEAKTVVAGVYVVPSAGKIGNTVAMADATGALLQQLLDRPRQRRRLSPWEIRTWRRTSRRLRITCVRFPTRRSRN
jgi:hypothetical protein